MDQKEREALEERERLAALKAAEEQANKDFVQQLVEKGEAEEQKRIEEEKAKAPKKTNWLERIRKEQLERAQREAKEKEERAKRIQKILDSDSDDGEDPFDYNLLKVDNNLNDFLEKINDTVNAESKILDAWTEKDVNQAATKMAAEADKNNHNIYGKDRRTSMSVKSRISVSSRR